MEDQKIVELFWNRDEQAINVIADKYGAYCRTIAWNILGNNEDADECVCDTYLNAWKAIPPSKPTVLPAFLGKITRTIALNRVKHDRALKRGGGQVQIVLDELAECVSGHDYTEKELERAELVAAINEFLTSVSSENAVSFCVDTGISIRSTRLQGVFRCLKIIFL